MIAISKHWNPLAAALVGPCLMLVMAFGCGDEFPERYSVTGTVKYNGQPVEKGTITFKPAGAEGMPASGTIEKGDYSLTTVNEDDGAVPGEYNVVVTSVDIDLSQMQKNSGGGAGRHDDIIKASKKAKHLVPSKYAVPDTSGLKVTVKAESNTFPFDLTD